MLGKLLIFTIFKPNLIPKGIDIENKCIFAAEIRCDICRRCNKSICIGPLIEIRQILNTRTTILMPLALSMYWLIASTYRSIG